MDYKQKYLKYKKKYLDLVKQQKGCGILSYEKIPQIILDNNVISTYNCQLQIYESVDDYLRFFSKGSSELKKNFTSLFKPLFDKFTNLLYINARGNGLCYINAFFIFLIMKKNYQKDFYKLLKTAYNNDNNFLEKYAEFEIIEIKRVLKENILNKYSEQNNDINFNVKNIELDHIIIELRGINLDSEKIKQYKTTYKNNKDIFNMINEIESIYESEKIIFTEIIDKYNLINSLLESTINNTDLNDASKKFFEYYNENKIDISYYIKIFTGAFIFSGITLCKQINDNDERAYKNCYNEITNINVPDVIIYSQIILQIFNCNIKIIEVNNTYNIIQKLNIDSVLYEVPNIANDNYKNIFDNIVIVKTSAHFQVLILPNSTEQQRKNLYDSITI